MRGHSRRENREIPSVSESENGIGKRVRTINTFSAPTTYETGGDSSNEANGDYESKQDLTEDSGQEAGSSGQEEEETGESDGEDEGDTSAKTTRRDSVTTKTTRYTLSDTGFSWFKEQQTTTVTDKLGDESASSATVSIWSEDFVEFTLLLNGDKVGRIVDEDGDQTRTFTTYGNNPGDLQELDITRTLYRTDTTTTRYAAPKTVSNGSYFYDAPYTARTDKIIVDEKSTYEASHRLGEDGESAVGGVLDATHNASTTVEVSYEGTSTVTNPIYAGELFEETRTLKEWTSKTTVFVGQKENTTYEGTASQVTGGTASTTTGRSLSTVIDANWRQETDAAGGLLVIDDKRIVSDDTTQTIKTYKIEKGVLVLDKETPSRELVERTSGYGLLLYGVDLEQNGATITITERVVREGTDNPANYLRVHLFGWSMPLGDLEFPNKTTVQDCTTDATTGGYCTPPPPKRPRPTRRVVNTRPIQVELSTSSASWLNPFDLVVRWVYTGDAFANDEIYAAAQAGAGESYAENSEVAHQALDVIAEIDPTPFSDLTNGVLHSLEGNSEAAKSKYGQAALGPLSDVVRNAKRAKRFLGVLDDVDDVGDVAKQVAKKSKKIDNAAEFADGAVVKTPRGPSGFEPHGVNPLPGTRVRPEGIPDGYRVRPTKTKGGTEYYNPANRNESVRVMQGNPRSQYPNSQGPYVRNRDSSGSFLDANGNRGPSRSPDTHIPLEDFRFNQ